jgi:hypothetical protein
MRERLLFQARTRSRLLALTALSALVLAFARPAPPERSVDAVAAMLGRAVGGEVGPDDFVWEDRGGLVADALLGRRVLFLAAPRGQGSEARGRPDLWRARVRLTRAGRPIGVRAIHDLTSTADADERELVARGRRVAFETVAGGVVQGIAVLDLDGEGAAREARGVRERLAASLAAWLETDTARGVGRIELTFDSPPGAVRFELTDDALVMALGPEAIPAALDLRSLALNAGPSNPFGAHAQRLPRPAPLLAEVAVELAGAVLGDAAAGAVRGARWTLHDLLAHLRPRRPPPGVGRSDGAAPLEAVPGSQADAWPPAPVGDAVGGEGLWRSATPPFVAPASGLLEPAPPAIVETFVRPDPAAPGAWVHLVALDLRQLELGLETGFARPAPAASMHGTGAVPPAYRPRAVAVFAGGHPRDAVELGVVADGRVAAPPVAGAGSIVLGRDAVSLGPWPFAEEVPPFVRSLWQTSAAPLVGPGAVPPGGRDGTLADRSALGHAAAGHLVYALAHDVGAGTLARALELAGCDRGYELAAGPGRPGLAFVGFHGGAPEPEARLIAPDPSGPPPGLASRSADEIFYVLRRDPRPPAPLPEGLAWVPDGGRQPAPAWLPAVHGATLTNVGAQVHLTSFAPGRFRWRIRAGAHELSARGGPPFATGLDDGEQGRTAVAIGLGLGRTTRKRPPRGLATNGAVGLPIRPESGLLVVGAGGPSVERSENAKPLASDADASELPLVADDGRLRPEARELGAMRARAALCVLGDGTVLVAATTFDSDEATAATLLERGCARVVALDRGAHQPSFVHRAGTSTPPLPRYEVTTLYGVDAAAGGHPVAMP